MTYKCPYTMRLKQYHYIICKKLFDETKNANQSMCAYQFLCQKTKQMEHTKGAEKCKLNHSS